MHLFKLANYLTEVVFCRSSYNNFSAYSMSYCALPLSYTKLHFHFMLLEDTLHINGNLANTNVLKIIYSFRPDVFLLALVP